MFNIRKKASHFVRKARYDFLSFFLWESTSRAYSRNKKQKRWRIHYSGSFGYYKPISESSAEYKKYWNKDWTRKRINSSSSRKKSRPVDFWTWKRLTHSHRKYRHRMASVRRSNRSHPPGGAWSSASWKWF